MYDTTIAPVDPEIDSDDPLVGRPISSTVHRVAKFDTPRPRNTNRCAECGTLWMDGKLTAAIVKGESMRLCVYCLHRMKG